MPEVCSCVHFRGFDQTYSPFSIILKQTTCKAGSMEHWKGVRMPRHLLEVCKAHSSLHYRQECSEVKHLAGCWLDEVHPSQCEACLANLPLTVIPDVSEELGEFLIGVLSGLNAQWSRITIGLEIGCEHCHLDGAFLMEGVDILIRIKNDHMLIFEMNLEVDNVLWVSNWKIHQMASGADTYQPLIYCLISFFCCSSRAPWSGPL